MAIPLLFRLVYFAPTISFGDRGGIVSRVRFNDEVQLKLSLLSLSQL